jgi:HEXXH motif-containing protein
VIDVHTIADHELAALAQGLGGAEAIRALWNGQHSKRLLLLKLLVDSWPSGRRDRDEAVAAIAAAEDREPFGVRRILVDPMVGAWTAETVRRLRRKAVEPGDLEHFGDLAAATTLHAGTSARLYGHARDGWLHLPAFGRIRVPAPGGRVELDIRNGRLRIDGANAAGAWQTRRPLTARGEPSLIVELDDIDPYRDVYHVPTADRLTDAETDEWRRRLVEAWRILTRYAPERAAEIAEGLKCLVPLTKPDARAARSATSKEAVGVIGLDRPRTAADFVVALVHEFQHSKLSAILDIVQLHDDLSSRTFFAPWRTDPRPVGGLLQGVYAFLGVADTWRALCTDPSTFPQAAREFAEARVSVTEAVATLAGSGLLTTDGAQFVRGMSDAVERLHATQLPAATVAAAERSLAERRATWNRGRSARMG